MNQRRPLVVLALDHDEPLLDMYRSLLAERGHGVRQARNAMEARDLMDLDVDVVVVDLHTIESGGKQFLELLGDEPGLRETPVLVMAPERDRALANGGWLQKPFRFDQFARLIEDLASKSDRSPKN